jgi:hypothetical protein
MSRIDEGRKLYERPRRPRFRSSTQTASTRVLRLLSSPLLALLIAICAWTIPSQQGRHLLRWAVLVLAVFPLWIICEYALRWWRSLVELEQRVQAFRTLVLRNANVADAPGSDFKFPINAITNESGTVHLIVPIGSASGLQVGSRLWTVHTLTHDVWGTVEVTSVSESEGVARAKPIDRAKPEFWDDLEDRMRKDPSPPRDFHLEPAVTFDREKRTLRPSKTRAKGGPDAG